MSFARKTERSENSNATLSWPEDAVKLTQDSDKDKCDLRQILHGILKSGDLSPLNVQVPSGDLDLTTLPSFEEAHKIICDANSTWESIPARVRAQFNHNQLEFLGFMENPDNREAIAELGFDVSYLPEASPVPQTEPTLAPTSPDVGDGSTE